MDTTTTKLLVSTFQTNTSTSAGTMIIQPFKKPL